MFKDLDDEIDQLWAEAVTRWKLGEPLYLSGEVEKAAKEQQEEHREHSSREGIIRDFLEQQVPSDWNAWPLERRRMFWAGGMSTESTQLVPRSKICALEIWCEAFENDMRYIKNSDTQEINSVVSMLPEWRKMKNPARFSYCKFQRGFEKVFTNTL